MTQIKSSESGFALLITLLLLGVLIAVTLSIVELSIRQVRLTVDGRQAELAFQAASAGVECAQRISRTASTTITNGGTVPFNCYQTTRNVGSGIAGLSSTDNTRLRRYRFNVDWNNRCTEIDLIVIATLEDDITFNNIRNIIASFPSNSLVCFAGSTCHIVAASGYSSSCANRNNQGVLKRELLLEF
jgi:Tfp pilus assembly protein PilX